MDQTVSPNVCFYEFLDWTFCRYIHTHTHRQQPTIIYVCHRGREVASACCLFTASVLIRSHSATLFYIKLFKTIIPPQIENIYTKTRAAAVLQHNEQKNHSASRRLLTCGMNGIHHKTPRRRRRRSFVARLCGGTFVNAVDASLRWRIDASFTACASNICISQPTDRLTEQTEISLALRRKYLRA